MGNWFQDSDIKTFTDGTVPYHNDWYQPVNAACRQAFKARQYCLLTLFKPTSGSAWDLVYGGTYDGFWWDSGGSPSGEKMGMIIPMRVGCVITSADLIVRGNNGAGGGSIKIRRMQWVTGTGNASLNALADVYDLGGANPFDTSDKWDRITVSSINVTIESGYSYFVEVQSSSGSNNDYLALCAFEHQFGN